MIDFVRDDLLDHAVQLSLDKWPCETLPGWTEPATAARQRPERRRAHRRARTDGRFRAFGPHSDALAAGAHAHDLRACWACWGRGAGSCIETQLAPWFGTTILLPHVCKDLSKSARAPIQTGGTLLGSDRSKIASGSAHEQGAWRAGRGTGNALWPMAGCCSKAFCHACPGEGWSPFGTSTSTEQLSQRCSSHVVRRQRGIGAAMREQSSADPVLHPKACRQTRPHPCPCGRRAPGRGSALSAMMCKTTGDR
jgi:hypothetical protein